jgi:dipeptidyl aminopeptidase/acylaminoacyl peptidase
MGKMRFQLALGLLAIVVLFCPPVAIADPLPVEVYGKLPAIEAPRLSPAGDAMAFLSSVDGRRCLIVHHFATDSRNQALCPGSYEVRSFAWKNANRLVLDVYALGRPSDSQLRTVSRLIAVDANGGHIVNLGPLRAERAVDFEQDQIIDMLPDDPAHVLIALYESSTESPDVMRVDVNSGQIRTVVSGQNGITVWKADFMGQVRLGVAVKYGIVRTYYRDGPDMPFRLIHETPASQASSFSVQALGEPGLLYVASTGQTGRRAIYGYDVATGRFLDVYATHPDVDIGTLVVNHGRPVGYNYTVDETEWVFTDPFFRSEATQIAAALPEYRTWVADETSDGRRTLILAKGGNRPGAYYLLSREGGKGTLEKIGEIRPDIPEASLAPVHPVTYQARDGLVIHGYVTLPPGVAEGPMPFVIFPHGGPSARDALDFDYLAQMMASRGYGVFQPNYRGSRGYGGAFEQAGFQQWGLAMQDDLTDGAKWLIDQKLADPGRICIVGWSYGGYAALMGAVKTPDLFRCAASMAGVTDLGRRLDRMGASRFADLNLPRFDKDPDAILANSPVHNADRIHIPILLAHGRRDFTVSVEESEEMEAALRKAGKPVKALYFDEDDHYLYREEDRIRFVKALESFLAENLGSGASGSDTSSPVN